MPSQPDVLQSCLQEAAKAARPALERCMDVAVAMLQDAELKSMKVAERDELAQAWRILQDSKPAWSARYPSNLQDAFAREAEAATAEAKTQHLPKSDPAAGHIPARSSGRLGAEAFSLVDDADVAQAIES